MTSSSVPAFGRRMAGPAFAPSEIKVYQPNLSKQWRLCALAMVFGLLGLLPLSKILHWLSGGPMPDAQTFLAASCLLFIPFGILLAIGAMRGLPRLIVTPYGVKVERIVVTTWANWDSIEPFVLKTAHAGRFNKQVQSAYAPVIGSHVSKGPLRVKRFILPDHFQTPIGAIAAELNAARAQAVGGDASAPVAAAAPQESPVGLAEFKLPWVTFALLIILVAVFTFENMFPLAPGKELAPSIRTLFGMGALSRTAVLSGGEWYRLFTAPLLHANFAHIAGNGVALLLGGCSGLLHSTAAPEQIYYLRPPAPSDAAPAAPAGASVRVGHPMADPGLDTPHIMLRQPDHRMSFYAGSRWPSAMPDLVAALVVQTLRASGKRG